MEMHERKRVILCREILGDRKGIRVEKGRSRDGMVVQEERERVKKNLMC